MMSVSQHPSITSRLRQLLTKELFLISFISLLGLSLRIYGITNRSLWGDELISFFQANFGWKIILNPFTYPLTDTSPPLYTWFLHLWMSFFGKSDFALRSLSAIFGFASIPAVYILAQRIANKRVALISSFLLAISPFQIMYSQESRNYALLTFIFVVNMIFFFALLNNRSRFNWIAFFATSILGVFTHFTFLVQLGAQNVFIIWRKRDDREFVKYWFIGQAAIVMSFLFLIPIYKRSILLQAPTTHQYLASYNLIVRYAYTLFVFSIGETVSPLRLIVIIPALAIFGSLFFYGFSHFFSQNRRDTVTYFATLFFVAALLPLTLSYLPKYLIFVSPIFLIVVAVGISELGRKWPWLILISIVFLSSFSLSNLYRSREFHSNARLVPFNKVANFIGKKASSSDTVILPYFVSHYYRGPGKEIVMPNFSEQLFRPEKIKKVGSTSNSVWIAVEYYNNHILDKWIAKNAVVVEKRGFLKYSETLAANMPVHKKTDHFKMTVYHLSLK